MTYTPRRIGKPEGYPFTVLDGTDATQRRRSLAALEPEPRAAMTISLLTGHTLDQTLWELRQLELRGQVKHTTDDGGVMRWVRMPENGWEQDAPF